MYTKCWLEYHLMTKDRKDENKEEKIKVFLNESDDIIENALKEMQTGFLKLFQWECILIREDDLNLLKKEQGIYLSVNKELEKQGYHLQAKEGICIIEGADSRGILYGVFEMLRKLQMEENLQEFEQWNFEMTYAPKNPLRMLNHWDNMDGSIERGYSGESFFFKNDTIMIDERTKTYVRLAASVGINGVVINNVNVKQAATELITERYFKPLREMSELFASYGIDLYLSVNYAAPVELGILDTADPCDEKVISWWKRKAEEIWTNLPLLGGFLIKADSEGRPGPFTYGRTHADGANMLADAVAPYGGKIIWRCFVYNCTQDWRDTITDRAKAGYDNFMPFDGQFRENVVLQIKNGPMDFQVREPVSPLFGGLKNTNMMLEVQVAQEYTGQQQHVCYLIPWFKQILDFDMHCEGKSHIAELISGKTYEQTICGIAAVANTGNDCNWTGHDLAAANLYGFGRLAFDTSLSAEEIAKEWIRLTFGNPKQVMDNLLKILMMSWPAYEKYTSPLGIGWMVNPNYHYGPNVDGYEYDRWGTYHRADYLGIGVDRTVNGTNFCGQYNEPLSEIYGSTKTCPDELLLFFHHVPYTHVLKSGKTVIQHIYDTHFEGAEEAELFLHLFEELKSCLTAEVYERILERLKHQKQHSLEWRDVINTYFYRKSGIGDEKGRKIYAAEI